MAAVGGSRLTCRCSRRAARTDAANPKFIVSRRSRLSGKPLSGLKTMAPFPNDESGSTRLDFRLLLDGGVVLYHSEAVLGGDLAWLRSEKYEVHEFDARRWKAEDDFHSIWRGL
jgi:hypothetical protein